jgi:sialidase-1
MSGRDCFRGLVLALGIIFGAWRLTAWANLPSSPDTSAPQDRAAKDGPEIVTVAQSTAAFTRRSEGDSIELAEGRLLLVSMEFSGDGSDFAKTRFVAHESADLGRTWGEHRVVATTEPGDMNVYSPNLIRGRDGSILLAFMRQHRAGALTNHVWKSTDEGRTFAPFATLTPRSDLALCNGTIKRLASGRLLLPASPPAPGRPAETGPYAAAMLYSDDDARTWQVSPARIELPMRGAMEPHVEQAADGRVLMVLRSQTGRVQLCESKDDGETWSSPRALELQAPESCPDIVRIPGTDHLLIVWNNSYDPKFRSHFGKRSPLSLALSTDHGQTWRHVADVETDPRRAFSNPGLRFTRAGHGLLNYWTCEYLPDWAMQDVIDLRFARLDKGWLTRLAGPR